MGRLSERGCGSGGSGELVPRDRLRPSVALALAALVLALPATARAQDASAGLASDASTAPAAADASATSAPDASPAALSPDAGATEPAAAASGSCQPDPMPAGHAVRIETQVRPAQPVVGDRVIVTYRLHHRSGDLVEFEPDPVAFAQPAIEMEYARQQPDRDRRAHGEPGGGVYGEVSVAVQPFKTGDVVIAPQLARLNAAGDVVRVCTPEVRFRVRDPFGNEPHPRPQDLTPPEVVTEDALRWRWVMLTLDALFVVVLATLAVSAYLRSRPKVVPPPPPPRPAWIVATEALDAIGRSDLLSRGATKDYYDAISDVIRRYVGASRGFDALEMTTDEVLARVRRSPLAGVPPAEVEHLLHECDLVKFARYVPSHEESENILTAAYAIVRRSSPMTAGTTSGGGGASGGTGSSSGGPTRTVGSETDTRRA